MISYNMLDYVKIYENFIDEEVCNQTIEELKNVDWEKHHYYNPLSGENHTFEDDLSVSKHHIPTYDIINKRIWDALETYIVKDFGFGWFNGWSNHTSARFNKYDPTTLMRLHCDHIHSIFDGEFKGVPILTVLGALNNEYEGGEFFMFGDKQIDLQAGSVIVFPSNFMYPHEVKKIKSGVRYSFVSWAF